MLGTCCLFLLIYALLTPTWAHQICPKISVSRSALSPRGSFPLPLFSRGPSPSSSTSSSSYSLPFAASPTTSPAANAASSATPSIDNQKSPPALGPTKSSSSSSSADVTPSSSASSSNKTSSTALSLSKIPPTNSSVPVTPSPNTSAPLPSAASSSSLSSSDSSASSSSPSSSSSSSGLCWTGGSGGDSLALTPDHRGNLWLLSSSSLGSQVTPGRVWVLNFTSLTWHDLRQPQDNAEGGHGPKLETSANEVDSPPTSAVAAKTKTAAEPLVFCPWSQGLVALYSISSSSTPWLRPYTSANWQRLQVDQKFTFPSGTASVVASWCGRIHDALWLLTATNHTLETETPAAQGAPANTERQTLWRLDHTGKWSALELVMGRESFISSRHNLRSWSDDRGDLFLLQEPGSPSSPLRVVKYDILSGTRTILSLHPSHKSEAWIPSASGELYSLFSDSQGSWIKTFSYYTGVALSKERTRVPRFDMLVEINGTVYNNMPRCGERPHRAEVGRIGSTVRLHHLSLSSGCPRDKAQVATLQEGDTPGTTASSLAPGSDPRRLSDLRAVLGGGAAVADVSTGPPQVSKAGRSHQVGHDNNHIFITDGTDGGKSEPPSGPHQRDKNHTNNSIIFFSLSLSIFALVGIIAFVRRCVRCPPAHDLGNDRETRGGKPPSPLPVLYSIVSEDALYETSAANSPCPSHGALYDAAGTPTTPTYGGTPAYATPISATPTTGLSPGAVARHAVTPASFPRDPVTYAITSTTSDVINIATNSAFAKYLTNSISDPTSIDTNTCTTNSTSTTQF